MAQTAEYITQQEKAKQFHNLHHAGKLLIFPNVWDCLGAILLESLSYPAIATASASVAFANGLDDGENISFDALLTILKKIVTSVNIPVSADIESGYAENEIQLGENIKRLIETGIVGINIEDTDKKNKFAIAYRNAIPRDQTHKKDFRRNGCSPFCQCPHGCLYTRKRF